MAGLWRISCVSLGPALRLHPQTLPAAGVPQMAPCCIRQHKAGVTAPPHSSAPKTGIHLSLSWMSQLEAACESQDSVPQGGPGLHHQRAKPAGQGGWESAPGLPRALRNPAEEAPRAPTVSFLASRLLFFLLLLPLRAPLTLTPTLCVSCSS